jgi:hypothetical protein
MAPAIVLQLLPATDVRGSLACGHAQIRWSTAFRRRRARASMCEQKADPHRCGHAPRRCLDRAALPEKRTPRTFRSTMRSYARSGLSAHLFDGFVPGAKQTHNAPDTRLPSTQRESARSTIMAFFPSLAGEAARRVAQVKLCPAEIVDPKRRHLPNGIATQLGRNAR